MHALKKAVHALQEAVHALALKEAVQALQEAVQALKEAVQALKEAVQALKEAVQALKEAVRILSTHPPKQCLFKRLNTASLSAYVSRERALNEAVPWHALFNGRVVHTTPYSTVV